MILRRSIYPLVPLFLSFIVYSITYLIDYKEMFIYILQFCSLIFFFFWKKNKNSKSLLLLISILTISIADFNYYLLNYEFKVLYNSASMFFFSLLFFSISYSFYSIYLFKKIRLETNLFNSKTFLTISIIGISLAFKYVLIELFSKISLSQFSYQHFAVIFKMIGIIPLFSLTLFDLISSNNIKRNYISLGFFGFCLLELGINAEIISYGELSFSFYDVFWFHSVTTICFGLFLSEIKVYSNRNYSVFNFTSLIKTIPIGLGLILAFVISNLIESEIKPGTILFVSCYMVIFISLYISNIIYSMVRDFENILLQSSTSKLNATKAIESLPKLPPDMKNLAISYISARINDAELNNSDHAIKEHHFNEHLSHILHDIRSPLSAIETLTDRLNTSEDQKSLLTMSLDRLNNIIDTNLENRRVSTNTSTETIIYSELHQVISEKSLTSKPTLNIISNLSNLKDKVIFFSSTEFKRVLSNILQNSIEANKKNNTIEIQSFCQESIIKIVISDYGDGIPKDVLDNYQSQSITMNKKNGNGIGLHYAYKTLIAHNSSIHFELRENGTDTILTFNLKES